MDKYNVLVNVNDDSSVDVSIVPLDTRFFVKYLNDEIVDVVIFDPMNPSHVGNILIDFDTLKVVCPNFKDFLKLEGLKLEWLELGLQYVGG